MMFTISLRIKGQKLPILRRHSLWAAPNETLVLLELAGIVLIWLKLGQPIGWNHLNQIE